MAEHPTNPHGQGSNGAGHETGDVNIGVIGKFAFALVIVVLLSIGLLIGVFQFFNTRDNREARSFDPVKVFPSPQLLPNEPKGLAEARAAEQQVLNGYGWVDQKNGVVRIPVDQAIELLAKRGLPVRQQTAEPASAVSMPTESGLGAPLPKPQEEARK